MMYKETIKKLPIYKGYYGIVITNNRMKVKRKHGFKSTDNSLYAHTFYGKYKGKQLILFIFNPKREVKLTQAQIIHECIHGVTFVFSSRDIIINLQNDEPAAYLAEYFGKYIFKFFKRNKIKL